MFECTERPGEVPIHVVDACHRGDRRTRSPYHSGWFGAISEVRCDGRDGLHARSTIPTCFSSISRNQRPSRPCGSRVAGLRNYPDSASQWAGGNHLSAIPVLGNRVVQTQPTRTCCAQPQRVGCFLHQWIPDGVSRSMILSPVRTFAHRSPIKENVAFAFVRSEKMRSSGRDRGFARLQR